MSFHVGQKIVRVGGKMLVRPDVPAPPIGEPCTVSNIYVTPDGEEMLEIVEFPAAESAEAYAGFRAHFFRPITEHKTDISIFKKLLEPSTVKVKERV